MKTRASMHASAQSWVDRVRVARAMRGLLWVVGALVALATPSAVAQQAPAGNERAQTQYVSEGAKESGNPFGDFSQRREDIASPAAKHAFAQQLDLEPLRGLAVFHNGRVKVLDTLAREMVETITGRKSFTLPVAGDSASGAGTDKEHSVSLRFDPLFTLLDSVIDPMFYMDKPLIGVNYLPLRRELLELEFPVREGEADAALHEQLRATWLRLGRVSPVMLNHWAPQVRASHMHESAYMDALNRVDYSFMAFAEGKANFMMVAPPRRDQTWEHVTALPADHAVREASLALGSAWRARDASGVNAAVAALSRELPAVHADVYPTTRRSLELFYNRLRAFEWGWLVYACALVTLLLAFGTQRRWLSWLGMALLAGGALLHATGFIARCIIAERFAIQNQFESMTGVSLFAVLVALGIMVVRRQWLFGAAAAAVGFMVLVTATQTAIPGEHIEREAAILNTSVLLKYHVTTVLVSYGLIALGFVMSLFYIGTHWFHKLQSQAPRATLAVGSGSGGPDEPTLVNEALSSIGGGADTKPGTIYRTLADLDKAQMIVLQLAFWTLGVGILLGAWWADHSWGRWWAFDPKETWALITWIVYLIVIHVRMAAPRNKAITTAWLSVVGFFIMLWTYFGVNLLLPGLHAYA